MVITWANGAIKNQWLEVQVLPTANTGLVSTDVFFWGNKVGDVGTGTPATSFLTSGADATAVLANLGSGATATNLYDMNRDGNVTAADKTIVLGSLGSITRIDIGGAGPFAPQATIADEPPTFADWQAPPISGAAMTTGATTTTAFTASALATAPVALPTRHTAAVGAAPADQVVAELLKNTYRDMQGYEAHIAFGLTADAHAWSQAIDSLGEDFFASVARGKVVARRQ